MTSELLGGRYQVQERIGDGATAGVFRAFDLVLGRPVAVKVLRPEYAADPAFRVRFIEEARAAARLTHPNIVNVYDVGVDKSPSRTSHFIVMELVDGPTLRDAIAREGPLPPERAIDLLQQVLAALGYSHQQGLVHRDVKPANVLLAPGPDGMPRAKVADFGIAAAANTPQPGEVGVVVGTALYISPEQATGQPATASSDLYAAGVMLFEMLTGHPPFVADSPVEAARQHVHAPVPSARGRNPRLSPRLDAIVQRAMAKNPAERFGSAAEFARALQGYLRLGLQQTSAMPVVGRPAGTRVGAPPAAPGRRRIGGIDWLAVLIGALIFLAFLGMIPLAAGVLRLYQPRLAQPASVVGIGSRTATPVVATTPTTAPSAQVTPTPTPIVMVRVPNLVGRMRAEAERLLSERRLVPKVVEQPAARGQKVGEVIAQQTAPDTEVREGETVELTIAKQPEHVALPTLIALTRAQAEEALRELGLNVKVSEEYSTELPAGQVLRQHPPTGEEVKPGTEVTLVVSRGPRPATPTPQPTATPANAATVPSVVKLHVNDAKKLLEEAGFVVAPVHWQSEGDVADKAFFRSVPVGHVLSQLQQPGTQLPRGSTINIAARAN